MKTIDAPGRLIVRDNPTLVWLFYAAFPVVGLAFLYAALTSAPDPATRTVALVLGLAAVAAGGYQIWKEPASVVELDSSLGRASIRRWGPFGGRTRNVPLSSIAGAEVEVGEHTDGGAIYRPTLILASGERAPASMFWYQTREPSAAVVERLRSFLGAGLD